MDILEGDARVPILADEPGWRYTQAFAAGPVGTGSEAAAPKRCNQLELHFRRLVCKYPKYV